MDYELIIFAGGYSLYPSIEAEMKALRAHPVRKFAATNDLLPLAARSGNISRPVRYNDWHCGQAYKPATTDLCMIFLR